MGQGYDGVSTMSVEKAGVQARILRQPKAIYTHCAGHSLNLIQFYQSEIALTRLKILLVG